MLPSSHRYGLSVLLKQRKKNAHDQNDKRRKANEEEWVAITIQDMYIIYYDKQRYTLGSNGI